MPDVRFHDRIVAKRDSEEPVEVVLELLRGIAGALMSIDARLERIEELLGGDNEGADADG
jgi:hypothetical protein